MEPRDGVCTKFERKVRVMADHVHIMITIDSDWTVSLYFTRPIHHHTAEYACNEAHAEHLHPGADVGRGNRVERAIFDPYSGSLRPQVPPHLY